MAGTDCVTVEELLDYLGIDETDDMVIANVRASLDAADAYLMGAVGADYPRDDPRAQMVCKAVAANLYDDRGAYANGTTPSTMRKMISDFTLQLRLELREEGGE